MGSKYTDAQKNASLKYQRSHAQIKITVSKDQKERYQRHVSRKGMNLTGLIVDLLEKDIGDAN